MRNFDYHTTIDDVQDMTIEEAISVLSHDANSDGKDFSARLHKQKAAQMAIKALRFMKYFDDLYGQGLGVANYHLNGDLEPLDNFIDSAREE